MAYLPKQNQSVSGTVGASIIGLPPVALNVAGSPVTTSNPVAVQPPASGFLPVNVITSVLVVNATQTGTRMTSITSAIPSSMLVGASIFGTVPVTQVTSPWIVTGSVQASLTPAANQSVSGTVQTDVNGSVATVIIGGSIAASFTPPANQSVSGTVNVGNLPVTQNVSGSVVATQGTNPWIITGSIQGTLNTGNSSVQVLNFPANQSVSGTVATTQSGTWISSIVNTIPSSVIVGASIFGLPPVNVTNTNLNIGGSVVAFQGAGWAGSVVAFQGGTRITSLVSIVPSSVIVGASIFGLPPVNVTNTNLNVGGSVVAFQGGTTITSISGIPQASVTGTVQIFPASVLTGHGSVNGAASVQVLAAPGAGLYTYVTDFMISNTGAATTLVTFTDGDGSVMGKSIAPAGGGAVAAGLVAPMKTMQTNKVVNIVAATATSVLHAWVGGYKAP